MVRWQTNRRRRPSARPADAEGAETHLYTTPRSNKSEDAPRTFAQENRDRRGNSELTIETRELPRVTPETAIRSGHFRPATTEFRAATEKRQSKLGSFEGRVGDAGSKWARSIGKYRVSIGNWRVCGRNGEFRGASRRRRLEVDSFDRQRPSFDRQRGVSGRNRGVSRGESEISARSGHFRSATTEFRSATGELAVETGESRGASRRSRLEVGTFDRQLSSFDRQRGVSGRNRGVSTENSEIPAGFVSRRGGGEIPRYFTPRWRARSSRAARHRRTHEAIVEAQRSHLRARDRAPRAGGTSLRACSRGGSARRAPFPLRA